MAQPSSKSKKSILFIGNKEDIDTRISKAIIKEFKIHAATTHKKVFNILDKFHPAVILLNLDIKDKTSQKKDNLFSLEFLTNIVFNEGCQLVSDFG